MNLDDSYFAVSKELEDGLHGDDNSKKKVKAYDNASRFMNGYAAVEINGKIYLVNEKFDICSEEFDGDMGELGTYIAATDGIPEYELNIPIPGDYKSSMPTMEEIEPELKD